MHTLESIPQLAEVPGPVSLAIGVFDGLHLGHRAVLARALEGAHESGGSAVAATFHPHPAKTLRPQSAPRLLTSLAHKERLIAGMGFPYFLVIRFDSAFACTPPEEFLQSLHQFSNPLSEIVVGCGWTFGKNRTGSVDLIRKTGARLNFRAIEIPSLEVDQQPVSSTRIRRAIEQGDFQTAERCLGRPFTILGTVVEGRKLGRQLGFPTANIKAHNEQFPPDGVYSVQTLLPSGQFIRGVANIGLRPTLQLSDERTLEVHLLDFSQNLYGQTLEIQFLQFLRPEKKFAGPEELVHQITRDIAAARNND